MPNPRIGGERGTHIRGESIAGGGATPSAPARQLTPQARRRSCGVARLCAETNEVGDRSRVRLLRHRTDRGARLGGRNWRRWCAVRTPRFDRAEFAPSRPAVPGRAHGDRAGECAPDRVGSDRGCKSDQREAVPIRRRTPLLSRPCVRLFGLCELRPTRGRVPRQPARLAGAHAVGRARSGLVDHRLHEPDARLYGDRGASLRHVWAGTVGAALEERDPCERRVRGETSVRPVGPRDGHTWRDRRVPRTLGD
jgi:hypothetical protein